MKINAQQLPQQLTKSHPGFWLASDEVFLQQISADLIREHAKKSGFERSVFYIDHQFNWDDVYQALSHRSLFNPQQLIELRFIQDKFSDLDRKALQICVEKLSPDILLLVLSSKIETQTQKAKWFLEITKHLCFVPIWPITPQQYLPWLKNRAQYYQLQIEDAALELLATQTQNNPWAADQIFQQLQLMSSQDPAPSSQDPARSSQDPLPSLQDPLPSLRGAQRRSNPGSMLNLTPDLDCFAPLAMTEAPLAMTEMIQELTHNAMQTDLFTFIDVFLGAQAQRTLQHLQLLKNQGVEPILIIWALARELRTLNNLHIEGSLPAYVWPQKQALLQQAAKYFPVKKIQTLIQKLALIDLQIKGAQSGNPWLSLERLILC